MLNIKALLKNGPVILDGATGTNLQKQGMPMGVCPELWIIEHPEIMKDLQKAYVKAGTRIIYAPTFTANRIKLEEYGLSDQVEKINQTLVRMTKETVGEACYVAGDLTMTGKQIKPIGNLDFEDLIDCYKEQIRILDRAGVDCLIIETMMHIGEARAALIAAKEVSSLPVMVTMTFEESGRTIYGTDALTSLITLQSLGADAVGINCSTGPDKLVDIVREMAGYATVPLIVKPNAGLPELIDGDTVFNMDKETFARYMKELVKAGASIVGGCCGTTPEYIREMVRAVAGMKTVKPVEHGIRAITNMASTVHLPLEGSLTVVGERINPTGKKALREELKNNQFDLTCDMALSQVELGAKILDVNVGMNGVDEKELMLSVTEAVNSVVKVPLCLDSSDIGVLEAALRNYHGRALVNSVSCETKKLTELLPIVKKYGAMFILLPLTDKGLPENFAERKANIETVVKAAKELGFKREDMVVDGLVATIGANKNAALDTLETIRYCKNQLGLATICGLSNISFGLPKRNVINGTFLALAIQNGLTMAIANPSSEDVLGMAYAADLLMNKEGADLQYIEMARTNQTAGKEVRQEEKNKTAGESIVSAKILTQIEEDILKGKKNLMIDDVKAAIDMGIAPSKLLNEVLIPSINLVGDYFNQGTYFLPQLIVSAEAMKKAVDYLEPMLADKQSESKSWVVILATVKGDIHDIGKNLVAMMMKNHGFKVIDLGKDVPKEVIIEAAITHGADIIGLSALMTTTMQEMRQVVSLAKKQQIKAKIMIGGAVITQDYCDEIGADGYSKDAVEAVDLVKRLMLDNGYNR